MNPAGDAAGAAVKGAAMPIDLICLDADDTLWHNMRFFAAAEDAFVAMLAPFAEAGIARDRLAAVEVRNLPLYGYGAKSFTLSMIETALECGADARAIGDVLEAGRALLAHPVELLDDIEDTLAALAERARLVLVTKGDLLHQEMKLAASGLGEMFHGAPYARYLLPALDNALAAMDGQRRSQDGLIVELAAELYRREHGRPPATYGDLLGRYLDTLPDGYGPDDPASPPVD